MDQTVSEHLTPYLVADFEGQSEQRRTQSILVDTYDDMSVTASLDLGLENIQCLGSCILGSREGNPLPTRSLIEGLLLRTLSLGHDTA